MQEWLRGFCFLVLESREEGIMPFLWHCNIFPHRDQKLKPLNALHALASVKYVYFCALVNTCLCTCTITHTTQGMVNFNCLLTSNPRKSRTKWKASSILLGKTGSWRLEFRPSCGDCYEELFPQVCVQAGSPLTSTRKALGVVSMKIRYTCSLSFC